MTEQEKDRSHPDGSDHAGLDQVLQEQPEPGVRLPLSRRP